MDTVVGETSMSDLSDLSDSEFVQVFLKKHRSLVRSIARRYVIPNRYAVQDIEQYIAERLLAILANRQSGDNSILDREKYFLGCLNFYCIEYQRLNGFIFCLPKRPRRNAVELERSAKKREFHYINEMMFNDPSLSYEDSIWTEDPGVNSSTWVMLTGLLRPEEADVIDCIHRRNLNLAETSRQLGVAQSTCLTRRNKAYCRIYNCFDSRTGEINVNLRAVLREGTRE